MIVSSNEMVFFFKNICLIFRDHIFKCKWRVDANKIINLTRPLDSKPQSSSSFKLVSAAIFGMQLRSSIIACSMRKLSTSDG